MLSNEEIEYNRILEKYRDIQLFLKAIYSDDYFEYVKDDYSDDEFDLAISLNRKIGDYIKTLSKINLRDTIIERAPITEDYSNEEDSLVEQESVIETEEDIDTKKELNFKMLEKNLFKINSETDDIATIYEKIMQLSEDTLRKLQELGAKIDEKYDLLMESEPIRNLVREIHAPTSILSDYREASWGMERVGLDGFQNHVPSDSKGTKCFLQFLVDNKWVNRDEALNSREKIKEIRFVDNGVGFSYENLYLLHSSKSSEDNSVGQFGEGMKLMANAATTMGLGVELQSRNWTARPVHEIQNLTNTRKGDKKEKHKRLSFDIQVYDGEPIIGSRTIFHTPTPEFIDFSLSLPEKIMQLGKIQSLYSYKSTEVLDIEEKGKIFVKGIYLCDANTLFSYNFEDAEVNPDRNNFANYNFLQNQLRDLIIYGNSKEIIKKILKATITYQKDGDEYRKLWNKLCDENKYQEAGKLERPIAYNEFKVFNEDFYDYISYKQREDKELLWQEAFVEACKELKIINPSDPNAKVALLSGFDVPENLTHILKDYTFVKVPNNILRVLEIMKVPTDKTVLPPYTEEIIKTSIPLNYGEELWNEQMIVTDATQNHLPEDSGGEHVFLRFQDKNGFWHDYREFSEYSNRHISAIKICDDGSGYDKNLLGIFASSKEKSNSSGKWGEGLKMVCAAALRKRN